MESINVDKKHLEFLDNLRDDGYINMFGAAPYLQEAFKLDKKEAAAIHVYWMQTYGERHPQ